MFGDELRELVRREVVALDGEIETVELLLAAMRGSRGLLQDVLSSAEVDSVDSPADGYRAGFLPLLEEPETAAPAMGRFASDPRAHSYGDFNGALLASGKSGTHDLVGAARVWADMHDGMVLSRDLATALRAMGFSRSSMENLPGYLSRKMMSSGEFEREGRSGSGLYRRVYPSGPAQDDGVLDWAADDEAAVPSGLSGDGTGSMD